jgi:S1-C subfamily serine protease
MRISTISFAAQSWLRAASRDWEAEMRLDPAQVGTLLAAMERAFDTLELQRVLLERCRLKLSNVAGFGLPFSQQIVQVHTYFDQRNVSEELVAAMRDARPQERTFVLLADAMGYTSLPTPGSFEVLVRKEGSPYQDVGDFRVALAKAEGAVCRVETGTGYGTGVLISKNIVLTNHHVVASVLDGAGKLKAPLHCLFDHKKSGQAYATPPRRVAATTVLIVSTPASEDYKPQEVATDPDQLDYALLSLAEDIGDQPVVPGGDPRGFVAFDPAVSTPTVSDILIVLQHPLSQPMKIDIGAVTAVVGTRLRHSVNTEKGSSGAPVFSAGLKLVALHHAGFDWPTADHPFNQAIPLVLIGNHAKRQGINF